MSKFDSDGRRRLSGLSQAIRKHAQQSTSPSSEVKYGDEQQLGQKQKRTKANKTKTAPTIEDRLRNLLNSDTEGADSQSASNSTTVNFDKPPTYELGSKGYHGSYSPRLAESKMKAERLNRSAGIESKNRADIDRRGIHQRTRSLSSENILKDAPLKVIVSHVSSSPPSSLCESGCNDDANGNKLRRCVSAVPASFNDENWNVVPESPKAARERAEHSPICPNTPPLTPSTLGRRTPTGAFNLAIWDQRPPPSPSRVMTLPSNSSLPNSPKQPTSPIAWPSRTYGDSMPKSNDCLRRTFEYTSTSVTTATRDKRTQGKFLVRVGSPAHIPISQPSGKDIFRAASPASPCSITQHRQSSQKQRPIQYVEPPLPASIRITSTIPRSRESPPDELKVSPLVTASHPSAPKSAPPVPTKRNSVKTENSVLLKPNDLIKPGKNVNPKENTESTHDDDPESCKSEDRDSGAILDAEPSVFDFDSSVLSESEHETLHGTPSKTHKTNREETTRERIWSRSSTPTLPPLSPYDSEVEISQALSSALDRDVSHDNKITTHSQTEKNEVARLPSYDSLVRKKAENLAKSQRQEHQIRKSESHEHELSPTESALAESCYKPDQVTDAKNHGVRASSKASTHRISRRRNSRASSRASSCDERRGIHSSKHRIGKRGGKHKRRQKNAEEYTYYEIEESTRSKKTLGRYPVFYRPGEDNVPSGPLDQDETSSVKSFTSASVTSSAMRKHGRRHHRRHHQHNGALEKAYAKEVRAANKRVTRLESHVVTLARSVAQLSSELRSQVEITHDVEDLRKQVEELRREKSSSRKSSTSSHTKSENQKKSTLFKAQPKRVKKLTNFFGEKPPILSIFLTDMGYKKYVPNFNAESIDMAELPYMDEERLKSIGIPLGPRLRILSEAKKTCFV